MSKIILSLLVIVSVFITPFKLNMFSYLRPSANAAVNCFELDYAQHDLKMVSRSQASFDVGYGANVTNYDSFRYGNKICSFLRYKDEVDEKWVVEYFRYDCENNQELPPINVKEFLGFDSSIMIIKGDTLTTYGMIRNQGSWLVSYDLETGKIVWCEPFEIVCRVGDNFLARERKPKCVDFSLICGTDGSEIWKHSFSDYFTTFCGVDDNNNGFFKHDEFFLTQIDLEKGTFVSKTNIFKGCFVFIKGNYILLQYDFNVYECIQIDTKKSLWKKQFDDDQYFIYIDDRGINNYHWKGIMISEEEVLNYNEEEIIIFNLKTGEENRRYLIPGYFIINFKNIDEDGNYYFQLGEAKKDNSNHAMLKTKLEVGNDNSFLYTYPQDYDYLNVVRFDACYFISEKTFFHQNKVWATTAFISTPS